MCASLAKSYLAVGSGCTKGASFCTSNPQIGLPNAEWFTNSKSTWLISRSMKGRPLSGGCREKTLNNHINVDALIQKGACNEARQVYGDGCPPGNDSGGGDRCGRQ